MEELLQYAWKHKILPLKELKTTDGRTIEVINPGIKNTDAGPDFHDAKIKIGGVLWVGDVELHIHTSDWFHHSHEGNPSYENIILHVASVIDCELKYPNGTPIPQLQMDIPEYVQQNYKELAQKDTTPRCAKILSEIPRLKIRSWLAALQVERLEMRSRQILERRELLDKDWEHTLFVTIARNFGFGKNGDAFELWAKSIPMFALGKHRDSLFQIEAIFFGQSGLLDCDNGKNKKEKNEDNSPTPYQDKLRKEYAYLRQKFSLTPISSTTWKFLRLRPQNFPHIRIAQLATLYQSQRLNLSKIINAHSIEDIYSILSTEVSDFWRSHYTFSSDSTEENAKHLSKSSMDLIIINGIAPFLYAYGQYKGDDTLCERAISYWEHLKPETNTIIRKWGEAGIKAENAGDSQAIMQLTQHYCDRRDCLRCRFGHEYISKCPEWLREKDNAT